MNEKPKQKELVQLSPSSDRLFSVVETALQQTELVGIAEVLQCVAESESIPNIIGCVMWEVPYSEKEVSKDAALVILAQWFKSGYFNPAYDLPVRTSHTGHLVLGKDDYIIVPDVRHAPPGGESHNTEFFSEQKIGSYCSIQLTYPRGTKGAISFYRHEEFPKISETEAETLLKIASIVPGLYASIRDKVHFNVLRNINTLLHEARAIEAVASLTKSKVKEILHSICKYLNDIVFHCVETSVFLDVSGGNAGQYENAATTCDEMISNQRSYHQMHDTGVTSWVLWKSKSALIYDMANIPRDNRKIQTKYPGIRLKSDSNRVVKRITKIIEKKSKDNQSRQISYVVVPLLLGRKILGVLRCCTIITVRGPCYFTHYDQEFLELIALRLVNFLEPWLEEERKKKEEISWKGMSDGVREMNRFVSGELTKAPPNNRTNLDKALEFIEKSVPNAEILDILLYDAKTQELYVEAYRGDAWKVDWDQLEISDPRKRRYQTARSPTAIVEWVYRHKDVFFMKDPDSTPLYSPTFENANQLVAAPIYLGNKIYGVVEIRTTVGAKFPDETDEFLKVIGQQLGLNAGLLDSINELRLNEKNRIRTFKVLNHQIRSPINSISSRATRLLEIPHKLSSDQADILRAIRGLSRKAATTSKNLGLFTDIIERKPLKLNRSRLSSSELIGLLIQGASDHTALSEKDDKLRINVDSQSFENLDIQRFTVDKNLLIQMLNDLLDNAVKYRFPGTDIRITGEVRAKKKRYFCLSVINTGIPISAYEIQDCRKLEWRSEKARMLNTEGLGLGLWIVDYIMQAHNGELNIASTKNDVTTIQLWFPDK